jgi:hypothetical protein
MQEPSLTEKIVILLGLVLSSAGCVWLAALTHKPPVASMIPRVGFVAAFESCLWLVTLCWAASLACVARSADDSLRFAGIPFLAVGLLMFLGLLGNAAIVGGSLVTCQSLIVPQLACRPAKMRFTTELDPSALPAGNSVSLVGK